MAWMPALDGFAGNAAFLLVGFEDAVRAAGPEQDFDDLVFAVVPASSAALSETHVFEVAASDRDRDGLDDAFDAYPEDVQRAFVVTSPHGQRATLALEEDYPEVGDLDYNDALAHFDWCVVSDARGNVKDVLATFDLVGRRSRFDHRLALRLPTLPDGVAGSVRVERYWGAAPKHELESRSIEECLLRFDGCLPDAIPSTRGVVPGLMTTRTRAAGGAGDVPMPASARVWISFDDCVDPSWLEPLPLEPFFVIRKGELECDVHLAGSRPVSARAPQLPVEDGPRSFVSRQGYPYLLCLPLEWRAPAEGVAAWDLYPGYRAWVATRGAHDADWYRRPSPRAEHRTADPRGWIPERVWQLQLPAAR
jgi:LruC domain-containing protein